MRTVNCACITRPPKSDEEISPPGPPGSQPVLAGAPGVSARYWRRSPRGFRRVGGAPLGQNCRVRHWSTHNAVAILTGAVLYFRYSRLIDARLRDGPFRDAVNIFSAPVVLSPGDATDCPPISLLNSWQWHGFTDEASSANAPCSPIGRRNLPAVGREQGGRYFRLALPVRRTTVFIGGSQDLAHRIERKGNRGVHLPCSLR